MKKILSVLASSAVLFTLSGMDSPDNRTYAEAVSAATETVTYTADDVKALQNYILGRPDESDLSDKQYDLTGDGCWDVFDLCLMKQAAAGQSETQEGSDTIVVYFSRTGNTEKIAG